MRPAAGCQRLRQPKIGRKLRPECILEERRGAVLAASHTGNWELAACVLARSLDLLVVTKPIREAGFDPGS